MPQVDFIFDFGSPNAYLAHKVIPQVAQRTGASVNYVPCLLGGLFKATGNQSPVFAFTGVLPKLVYEHLEIERFAKRYALDEFTMNPSFPINTLQLMRGATLAQLQSKESLMQYTEAVFQAMWEDEIDLEEHSQVVKVLTKAGYQADEFLAETQTDRVKQALIENTEQALARGAFGVPTFYVGEQMFFGKVRLPQVEEEIIRQSGVPSTVLEGTNP